MQRLLPLTTGNRLHADRHQAVVRSGRQSCSLGSAARGAAVVRAGRWKFRDAVRARLEAHAVHDVVEQLGATAVDEPTWPEDYSDTRPVGVFVDRVGAAVQRDRATGVEPAVLAGNGRGGASLRPEILRGFAGHPGRTARDCALRQQLRRCVTPTDEVPP